MMTIAAKPISASGTVISYRLYVTLPAWAIALELVCPPFMSASDGIKRSSALPCQATL